MSKDWDKAREYNNGVARAFGAQTIFMAKDKIKENPKNFYIIDGLKRGGAALLIIKSPYGSLKLLEGKVSEAIEKKHCQNAGKTVLWRLIPIKNWTNY